MSKDCDNCLKRKTMLCPNSNKCYALDNKPYYVDKDDAIKEIERLNNIIDDLKQKNNLAENILYDYLYNDDKITKEKYEQFKGLKEGKQC